MDAAQAISLVVERIYSDGLDYPTEGLAADRFEAGWCVYASAIIGRGDPMADIPEPSVFLVHDDSGSITEVEDPDPESLAEACLWFSAEWTDDRDPGASAAPAFPDLWGPRRAASYDRQAIDILAQALARERNFPGWLAGRLAELADLLGGSHSLIARRPGAFGAEHVTKLADRELDGRTGVWQNWPAADPASLPEADTTGWLLTPGAVGGSALDVLDSLDVLEAEEPAVMRLADAIVSQSSHAPLWRACGVIEFAPPLIAIRLNDQLAADLDELRRVAAERPDDEFLREILTVLLTSSPGDPDVETLLRLAIDAGQRGRDVIDLDVAAASAYRRVLDRLGLPFDTEAWNMMFE
jgi:hypothetical protein